MTQQYSCRVMCKILQRSIYGDVIIVSPGVFVRLCVCACVRYCRGVFPYDLTMEEWCHANTILQVDRLGVVQVICLALIASLMTSPCEELCQNWPNFITRSVFIVLRPFRSFSKSHKTLHTYTRRLDIIVYVDFECIFGGRHGNTYNRENIVFKRTTSVDNIVWSLWNLYDSITVHSVCLG